MNRAFVSAVVAGCMLLVNLTLLCQGGVASGAITTPKLPPEMIDFGHMTIKDGLPNMVVYNIVQDKEGFLWFSTGTGICRYDGYQFKNYTHDESDPYSIGKGPVANLFLDDHDRMWVAVFGSGLYRFDQDRDRFISFKHDPEDPFSISSDGAYGIAQDEQGYLWVTTIDAGVNRYDEAKGRFYRYRHNPDNPNSISGDRSFGIFKDSQGDLWMDATGKSINRYNIRENKWTHYLEGLSQAPRFMEDRFGDLWVSIVGRGISRFNKSRDKITTYRHDASDPYSLSHNHVTRIMEDSQGIIWIATWGGGLCVYDREKDRFVRYRHNPVNPGSIISDDLISLFQDRTGVIWIGSYGAGMSKYDRKTERFAKIRSNPGNPNSLSHNNIKSIFQGSRGNLWIGTLGGGLNRFDPKGKIFRQYRNNPHDQGSISHDHIWKVAEDKQGFLWIATANGLSRFDRNTNSFINYRREPGNENSLGFNVVRTVFVDHRNTLWIGLQLGGIDRYDREQNKFVHYRIGTVYNSSFLEDSMGTLWAGNPQGIFRYDRVSDAFVRVRTNPDDPKSVFREFVTVITEDRKGNLWIGRNNGLTRYDLKTGKFEEYSRHNSLKNQDIAGIIASANGSLWISTSRGLTLLNPETGKIQDYDLETFNRGAYYKSDNGELLFGSTKGLVHFHADAILNNPVLPPIALTSFKKFNQEVKLDMPLLKLTELTLNHRDRFFSLEFSALDYSDPVRNRYKYQLEGFDVDWQEVGSKRRIATYTNLDGGDYVFRVQGSNNDGVWNKKGVKLKIKITPPFWETWWWITLCVVFVVGIFGLVYWNKTVQLRKVRFMAAALGESEEKYRNVIENAIEAICVVQDNRFKYFNPEMMNMFGYSAEELRQLPAIETVYPDERDEVYTQYLKQLRGGQAISLSARMLTKDKRVRWADIKAVTINWDNCPAMLVLLADVTEKKRTRDMMIQTEKMMSLGGLAAGMAHELNNPLGGMLQGVQNVQRRLSLKLKTNIKISEETGTDLHNLQSYLEKRGINSLLEGIRESGKKASQIISNMLQFSRKSESQMAPTNLVELIENVLELAGKDYNLKKQFDFRTINIIKEFDSNLPLVPCTETEIEQVILNLLNNAAWAMVSNGDNKKHRITLRLKRDGETACMEVEDNGPGMDEETRNRIFEPFFTTKPVGEGTGLGLSVSYMIVTNNHNGTLEVESEPGGGARFILRLPLKRET